MACEPVPEPTTCEKTVHENVCIEALVRITPNVVAGDTRTFCVGDLQLGPCIGEHRRFCEFTVHQEVCVQVPLTFSATAVANFNGAVCGGVQVGDCEEVTGCTHTRGFYDNHPVRRDELIELAGGTILLGESILGVLQGLSIEVTTANAQAIFDGNIPPPAPQDPPLGPQYRQLYIQLLTAKLNVLNDATCEEGDAAIAAADDFIANSPAGGEQVPPELVQNLDDFNNGRIDGCPPHCDDPDETDD